MQYGWQSLTDEQAEKIREIRAGLDYTKEDKPKQSIDNVLFALERDPILGGAIKTNLLTDRTDIVKDVGWRRIPGTPRDDEDDSHIYLHMERYYGQTVVKKIEYALRVVASKNTYHPIIDYLEGLVWDGTERLPHALHHFLGAEESELNTACLKISMLGAIHRLYRPGCKFDTMLCLVGGQGAGKSTFIRFLCLKDEWFSDDLKKLDDDKVFQKMAGHWFIEMSEMLGTASAKSNEEIKAFLSKQKETYKVPWDKHAKDRLRQCVFWGTSNIERFLPLDRTGNRRFLPVPVDPDKAEVHILTNEAASREYIRQLWAEVMEIYRRGDWSLILPPELQEQMDLRRQEHMAEDTSTGIVQAWLDNYTGTHVCSRMIYNECYKMLGKPDNRTTSEINSIMNNTIAGWVPGPQHRFKDYGAQRSWVRSVEPVNEPDRKEACKQLSLQDTGLFDAGEGFLELPDDTEVPFL